MLDDQFKVVCTVMGIKNPDIKIIWSKEFATRATSGRMENDLLRIHDRYNLISEYFQFGEASIDFKGMVFSPQYWDSLVSSILDKRTSNDTYGLEEMYRMFPYCFEFRVLIYENYMKNGLSGRKAFDLRSVNWDMSKVTFTKPNPTFGSLPSGPLCPFTCDVTIGPPPMLLHVPEMVCKDVRKVLSEKRGGGRRSKLMPPDSMGRRCASSIELTERLLTLKPVEALTAPCSPSTPRTLVASQTS